MWYSENTINHQLFYLNVYSRVPTEPEEVFTLEWDLTNNDIVGFSFFSFLRDETKRLNQGVEIDTYRQNWLSKGVLSNMVSVMYYDVVYYPTIMNTLYLRQKMSPKGKGFSSIGLFVF